MTSTRPYQMQDTIPKSRTLFYGGSWHEPLGDYKPTFNPANGDILAECASAHAKDVDLAINAAHAAFRQWWQTSTGNRASRAASPSRSW